MKYIQLHDAVVTEATRLRTNAEYSGDIGDGGSAALLSRLEAFKQKLVVEMDLRPSEYGVLNDVEVGIPEEFDAIAKKALAVKHKPMLKDTLRRLKEFKTDLEACGVPVVPSPQRLSVLLPPRLWEALGECIVDLEFHTKDS